MNLNDADPVAVLRGLVFGATDSWNAAHPHPLGSHHEHASVNVTQVFSRATGAATYSITVVCGLAGTGPLTFHGPNLAAVAEQAELTIEHRIETEQQRRADRVYDEQFDKKYALAG